ncbi:MAG TPA: kynureninase [Saprospiraceae bacterium]|nr:kynureninase [Saprospiraceae bacterium]
MISFDTTRATAEQLDEKDPLKDFRQEFLFPQHKGRNSLYFCGNSLGIQPKGAMNALRQEMDRWRELGVEGHFEGELPWTEYHKALTEPSAHIVGARPEEVIIMNTLTVNLHLMMVSFYRPTKERFKIIMEAGAFPSDQYAVETQVKFHGYDPEEAIIEVMPRAGKMTLEHEDILSTIEEHGAETALVLFGGLNYYTGQLFDMQAITEAGHRKGALVGFDLAHAAGNVPMQMHDWGVDFAVWCTYKYINSGPGALSGCFIHERHVNNQELPRFAGWWGQDEKRRFLMEKGFVPNPGAEGWQISNAPIMAFPPMKVSHELHQRASMTALRQKSKQLTGYLEFLIDELNKEGKHYEFITPRDPEQRGAQLSFITGKEGKELFDYLTENGVICDWREHNLPNDDGEGARSGVIRIAPAPIYNSYLDVWELVDLLRRY